MPLFIFMEMQIKPTVDIDLGGQSPILPVLVRLAAADGLVDQGVSGPEQAPRAFLLLG